MESKYFQRTIANVVECSGIGVHSGKNVSLTIRPAPVNHGIRFSRVDLPNRPVVQARFNRIVDTSLATVIGAEGFIVSTIEHLMSAFSGLGIDNALVEVDAYELPIMDGSAGPFARLLLQAGTLTQDGQRCFFVVDEPIELKAGGKFVGIYPDEAFKVTCTIEYDHPLIQTQSYSLAINPTTYAGQIAGARTFGFLHEVEYMKKFGLAQGGSLDNAVVVDKNGVLNEGGLRFADEFVRHKILDCIGDFSLLGLPILGHVVAEKSGHAFHHAFLEKVFAAKSSWQTCMLNDDNSLRPTSLKPLAN